MFMYKYIIYVSVWNLQTKCLDFPRPRLRRKAKRTPKRRAGARRRTHSTSSRQCLANIISAKNSASTKTWKGAN